MSEEPSSRVSIAMVRATLDDAPAATLPKPYSFRNYQPEDVAAWVRIHRLADRLNVATPEPFAREFGENHDELARRQLYLCREDGQDIGTITAWHNDHYPGLRRGRVHWVAIVPDYHGRGLGKPLLGACLQRLSALGYGSAYLTTDPPRVPAINLYLRCGFRPDVRSERENDAWHRLAPRVKPEFRPAVEAALT